MKKTVITVLSAVGLMFVSVTPSLALSLTLTNGGLGQIAAEPQEFGVSVCAGNAALTQSVPVTVSANGEVATVPSAASITTGSCEYAYLPYSQFHMNAGQTYTVNVTVDAQHSVSSNTNNQTSYTVTVPAQVAATVPAKSLTADASAQVSNPIAIVWNWIVNFFHSL